MTTPEQIDIEGSPLRLAGLFLLSCGFVALSAWLLYARPVSARSIAPGSFGEFALYVGIAFFGLAAAVIGRRLFRSGPVVSVGPRGIFDRRLSSDWIAWDAISGIGVEAIGRQQWLALRIAPDREETLPLRSMVRVLARLNRGLGSRGYSVGANDLKGGLDALVAAVDSKIPRPRES